jgi:1,4-alpha-glucan branching enzyme
LLQSSDWPFILTTGAHAEYAAKRVRDHTLNFLTLESSIRHRDLDVEALARIEALNNPFPDLDYRIFETRSVTRI